MCGAGNQPAFVAKIGTILSRVVAAVKGQEYRSPLLYSLVSGSFISAIDDPRTEFDWLSTDPKVVDAYCADPLSGVRFSAGGYATLTDLVSEAVSKDCAEATPHDLPLLLLRVKKILWALKAKECKRQLVAIGHQEQKT